MQNTFLTKMKAIFIERRYSVCLGEGAEFDHSLKQRNIIGAFAEAEANSIFNSLPDIGMRDFSNFEVPDLTSTSRFYFFNFWFVR